VLPSETDPPLETGKITRVLRSRYKDPHGHREGRDADEADVVYIRAQLRPSKGKSRRSEIMRGVYFALALSAGSRMLALAGLTQHDATSLRRMR
jgi:hypothetical protein